MKFGVYVHIPYCLQRCVYCDFATYEKSQILPPSDYLDLLSKEINFKARLIGPQPIDTIYFGGGTPSLLEPQELVSVIKTLADQGFKANKDSEITLEINPATIDAKKLDQLLEGGFNRFSIGVQTFSDRCLQIANRKHTAEQTRQTLSLFKGLNFSGDILFALPTQTTEELKRDVDELLSFEPKHVSPYYLTVPESNPMAKNRPLDDDQVKMFEIIANTLAASGFHQYEISNFSLPGFESRHNQIYWDNSQYWGIGLSSHSYLHQFDWGFRFWNPRSIIEYEKQINALDGRNIYDLHKGSSEILKKHEAKTDFTHTALRTEQGIDLKKYSSRFGDDLMTEKSASIQHQLKEGLLEFRAQSLRLTPQGRLLSNKVFEHFLFT